MRMTCNSYEIINSQARAALPRFEFAPVGKRLWRDGGAHDASERRTWGWVTIYKSKSATIAIRRGGAELPNPLRGQYR